MSHNNKIHRVGLMPRIRLYMAPMKGFTDHLFRSAFADHFDGFDLAVAPFIASKQDHRIKSGMLPYTDRIRTFLDRVIPEIRGSLSIKMRLGWKENADIFRLLPVIDQYPLSEIIIHPRTGLQRYEGPVDLDAFEDCLAVIRHPVVYNGDIRTVGDFRRLSRRFDRVHAWMIGRWCLADPFLPGRITTGVDNIPDKIYRMQRFHEALFEAYNRVLYGPSHVLNKMKGLWRYFSLPFEDCKKTMKKIKKTRRPDQYLERVNLFFETEAQLRRSKADLST